MGKYAALFAAPPDDSLKIPTYTPPPAPPPIEYGPQPSPEETSNAALARAYPGAATVDDAALLNRIGGKYKALDPYMKNAAIVQRQPIPGDDRQLEFHHPLSAENPVPGKMTFELFRPFKGQEREDAVAADALHYLGGRTQDDSGPPVDPQWSQLRDRLWNARSASQKNIDDKTYRDEHENGQSFDDWASRNRKDAYVRGGMFPEENPEWNRGPGDPYAWTPEQNATFTAMRDHLANGPKQDFKIPTYTPPEDQAGPVSPESQAWAMSPPVQTANAQARLEGGQGTWEDRKALGKSVPTDQDEGREFAKFAARAAAGELAAPLIGKGVSAIAARVRAIQAARAGAGAMPPIEEAAPPVALNAQGSKGGAVDLASRLAAKQAAEDWAKEQATGQLDYEPAPAQPDGLAEHGLQMHTWQPFKDDEVFSKWKTTPEFNGVGLVQKDDPSKFVAIHRSTKEPGRWQASSFDADGAIGDSIRDNPDELLQDYSHKWYNPVALNPVPPEAVTEQAAKLAEPLRPTWDTPSDPGFVYHGTNEWRAHEIAESKKLLTHEPGEFTDQDEWPDGSTQKRLYGSRKAGSVASFLPEEGKGAILRVPESAHPFAQESSTGDIYSTKPVPSSKIQIGLSDGTWHPLDDWHSRMGASGAPVDPEEQP